MKKIFQLAVVLLAFVPAMSFGQQQAKWPEMKAFHAVMSATFHPSEEGNLAPLKERAAELFQAAKKWQESEIPEGFKKDETTKALKELVVKCGSLQKAVESKRADDELKRMIAEAHDVFHHIVGECRNADH